MSVTKKSASPAQMSALSPPPGRNSVVYDILRTASSIRRAYAGLFHARGITFQQYNVIRILRGAGPQGLPTLEIADRMIDETPGITRLLDRLEAKQLIRRERPANNRRQVLCFATQKGLHLLRELDEPTRNRVKATVRHLSDGEVEVLLRCLERIRNNP